MASWTPGSYMIREYARHVEALVAYAGGMALRIDKLKKNRWRVATGGGGLVRLRYRVYGHELTVRTNWIDAEQALLNGAPTFITCVDALTAPHEVSVRLPEDWRHCVT